MISQMNHCERHKAALCRGETVKTLCTRRSHQHRLGLFETELLHTIPEIVRRVSPAWTLPAMLRVLLFMKSGGDELDRMPDAGNEKEREHSFVKGEWISLKASGRTTALSG